MHVNLNMFKKTPNIKKTVSVNEERPLRRSRRIAHRKGEMEEDDEDEDMDF